jgi:aspartyl/asparaginyl beta-hydroxylase (cupin superfamily)
VPLVSPNGDLTDAIVGSMRPTQHLERCPAIMGLMAELDCTWGRSRLMALAPGAQVPVHVDLHYYWRTHFRLHIPVITNPGVLFTCNDETVHMAAGECWLFDSFALHNVQNRGTERRVHLVLDTAGGEKLWDLVEESRRPRKHGAAPMLKPARNWPLNSSASRKSCRRGS